MSKYYQEKYEKRSVNLISKETSVRGEKKYKNQRQAEYHHTLKEESSVRCCAKDMNLGPLVYEASALPIELSFRLKV